MVVSKQAFNYHPVPPKLKQQGPLSKKVVVGEAVELPCEATGTPTPRIMWQKGTRVLANSVGETYYFCRLRGISCDKSRFNYCTKIYI